MAAPAPIVPATDETVPATLSTLLATFSTLPATEEATFTPFLIALPAFCPKLLTSAPIFFPYVAKNPILYIITRVIFLI